METIIKDLPLPKEATKMIEEVPALKEIIEPEPQGIGVGEGMEDLQEFRPKEFVDSLF